MAVRKIKGSWWVDFRFNGERYRKRSPDNSKPGAQSYEAYLRQKLARGESLVEDDSKQAQTFKEFAWKWFETYVKNNNKYAEVKNKEYTLKTHLIPYFGASPINRVTNLQVEEYKAKKLNQDKLHKKTINYHLAVLSKCLRTAQEWYDIEKLPKIRKFGRLQPPEFVFLSYKESERLLDHADGIWHEMILVALKTGLRLGELRSLDWSDIDWEKRLLTVRRSLCGVRNIPVPTKTDRIRYIPLVDSVCEALYERKQASGFIFVDEKNKLLLKKRLSTQLARICRQAGIRKIGWHTLRHTFASHLAMRGVQLQHIRDLLGHTRIETTLRYAHLSESSLRKAVAVLEAPDTEKHLWATGGQPLPELDRDYSVTGSPRAFRLASIR